MTKSVQKNSENAATPKCAQQHFCSEKFNGCDLGQSIIDSLATGIIAFDEKLRIIQANTHAAELIDLEEYIDISLAKGTDKKIWGDWTKLLRSVIETGKTAEFEAVKYNSENKKELLHIVCTPLKKTGTSKPVGGAVVIEDVAEKVNIEHQLAQAERLAAIGKVAGKVAHELSNPMDGILRYINLALRSIENEGLEKSEQYLQRSRKGLMRMVRIINELLEFSRNTYSVFERLPVDQMIEDAVKTMEPKAGEVRIRILGEYAGAVPMVTGGSLFQVFCNLIKNAIDAMHAKGELEIKIKSDDDIFTVEFRDTGPGIDPKNVEAIFEPFFTTKESGRGTGLGLAICKDIIEKYEGRITAENAPQGGSVFTVHLPAPSPNSKPAP